MKKYCFVLLCLLLCVACAMAEDDGTFAAYENGGGCSYAARPGGRAEIVEFHLAEGQTEVFIPLFWNNLVVYVEGETIPEQVEVVYTPWGSGIIDPAEGRTLTEAFYVTDQDARMYYSDMVKDIRDGDIVLMDVRKFSMENGERTEGIAYLKAENFSASLEGHRVNTTALPQGAFAYLAGECWHHAGYGFTSIVDAELPQGAGELVVPTDFAGEPFVQIWMEAFDENLRTIYLPYGVQGVISREEGLTRGSAYCMMYYADYDMVMADPTLRNAFPDMGQDDYALVSSVVSLVCDSQNGTWEMQVGLLPETLPAQLRGHNLLIHPSLNENMEPLDFGRLYRAELDTEMADWFGLPAEEEETFTEVDDTVYSCGELLYTIDNAQQLAVIVDYDLMEGQTELFVPAKLDGYTAAIEYELVPLQIKTLWLSTDCARIFWNYGEKPRNHERQTYTYSQAEESTIVLESVWLDTWDAKSGVLESVQQIIDTDRAPKEIAGNTVILALDAGFTDSINSGYSIDGIYSTNGWKYTVSWREDGEKEAWILDVPQQDWGETMVLPQSVNGYAVKGIELEGIPQSIKMVIAKGEGHVWNITNREPIDRILTLVNYTDWAGAGCPADMQKDELMWVSTCTRNCATGEELRGVEGMTRAEDLPLEIDGHRMVFPKESMEFLFTCGDWRYTRAAIREEGVIYALIYQYLGEENAGMLVVPETLDGYRVAIVENTALSETVEMICTGADVSVSTDSEIIQVAYGDYDAYRRLWGSAYSMPADAAKDDLIWQYASQTRRTGDGYTYSQITVGANLLPGEINGQRVLVPYTLDFVYTSGEWEYSLVPYGVDNRVEAWISGTHFPEGVETITVPKELGGYSVNCILGTAIPESVYEIRVPKGCYVRQEQETVRENLKIVEYRE